MTLGSFHKRESLGSGSTGTTSSTAPLNHPFLLKQTLLLFTNFIPFIILQVISMAECIGRGCWHDFMSVKNKVPITKFVSSDLVPISCCDKDYVLVKFCLIHKGVKFAVTIAKGYSNAVASIELFSHGDD